MAGSTHQQGTQTRLIIEFTGSGKDKTPIAFAIGVSELNLDDDLLSHGETPHYHRRYIVSLLSSGWDQVVPMFYGRQEILYLARQHGNKPAKTGTST